MSNRWMAFILFGLGMAAGPMAFHLGDSLLKPAGAEDAPLLVTENPSVKGEFKAERVKSTPSQGATWDGYTLSFDRNGAGTLQARLIHTGDSSASDGKLNFTESVKILNGAFNFNVFPPTRNTPGIFNAAGISPIVANTPVSDVPPGCQLRCCQVIGDGVDRSSIPTLEGSAGCAIDCQAGAATNLVDVSDVNTTFGTISFVGGACYGVVLTANTIQNAEALPETGEQCTSDLTAKYLELSQELARRKLQRLTFLELTDRIEELKQEIANDEAMSKLVEARKQLKDLMDKHPDSPAAQSAKRMLDADQSKPEPTEFLLTPVDSLQPTRY